jgi:enolase-phosphatase E1
VSGLPPAAILIGIEGTAARHDFARAAQGEALREALPALAAQTERPDIAEALAETERMVPGQPALVTLLHWSRQEPPAAPLVALRALLLGDAFTAAPPADALFPDVPPCLRLWARVGLRLYGLSDGPAELARLPFAHAPGGGADGIFAGMFDARVGHPREPDSYARLAIAMNVPTVEVLFLSAKEAALDAAAVAGMRTCQVLRPGAGPESRRHPAVADFPAAARAFGLPAASA